MPRRLRALRVGVAGLLMLAVSLSAHASTVLQLNLGQMVQRADRIYRGTVISATAETVSVGGGQLPTTVYRLRVDEAFRGEFTDVKGVRIAELRMLGKMAPVQAGTLRRASLLPRMPDLQVGQTYLVLSTRPSAIGLSTTVGLGQGLFHITQVGKDEQAINEAGNRGLFRDMPQVPATGLRTAAPGAVAGPLPYGELAGRIRGLVTP